MMNNYDDGELEQNVIHTKSLLNVQLQPPIVSDLSRESELRHPFLEILASHMVSGY